MVHRLLIYMPLDGMLMLVDEAYSDDQEHIMAIAASRQKNNPSYKLVLVSYKQESVKLLP